jgi:hypothetical protein
MVDHVPSVASAEASDFASTAVEPVARGSSDPPPQLIRAKQAMAWPTADATRVNRMPFGTQSP